MFGRLFDPPHVKAERQAAKSLGTLRQKAAADLEIELRILSNAMSRAERNGDAHLHSGGTWNAALGAALYEAQEFVSNIENALPATMKQLAHLTQISASTNRYDELLEFEAELREAFSTLTVNAGMHIKSLSSSMGKSFIGNNQQALSAIDKAHPKASIEERMRTLDMSLNSVERKIVK